MDAQKYPRVIYLLSGKRKCGKDYISEILQARLGSKNATIVRLSAPIKSHWAKEKNLKFDELLSSGNYKEKYRKEMIEWGEKIRQNDYGYFCKAAIEMSGAQSNPIWIVSDVRRKTDIMWFFENYPRAVKTIRVVASEETRLSRGWTFEKGVDDVESECDLDDFQNFDLIVNNDTNTDLETSIQTVLDMYSFD